jgi:hypothetical protein
MSQAKAYAARVKNGRLVMDEPTDLPEGTVVELFDDPYAYLDYEEDDMDVEERERLHASIQRGLAQMRAGLGRPVEEFLEELRRRG